VKKKFLLIRFSSIGDIVLTSPVIRCLKKQVPGCEVHFLTKKRFHSLLSANPYIDRIHLYEDNFREIIPGLKAEKFDFIADLHKNFRSWYVRAPLMRPSGSFPKLNLRKWLLVRFRINFLPAVHLVDRYFGAVEKTGVKNDGAGLDYFIPPDEEIRAADRFPGTGTGFIAIAIGAKHTTKILPADKVVEVCDTTGKPVILLGGQEDHERGEFIRNHSKNQIYNSCGTLTVNQSASVIRQCETLITNDTGMMHIGAAFLKKIISVWGNTVPAFGMFPYFPDGFENRGKIVEVTGLNCRPCSKLGYDKCPKKHFNCMNMIRTGDITEAL
jgi:ADP-heptose:LPS heptosyltransferase